MNNNDKPADSVMSSVVSGLEPLSRRRFLRAGMMASTAASAVVATGCASLGGRSERVIRPDAIRTLSQSEYEVMYKLTRVLLPTDQTDDLPSSLHEVPTIENIDYMIGKMPQETRKLFSLGVKGFDYGSVGLSYKFKRFAHLSDADALVYVESWQEGSFVQRGLMTSLKSVVTLNYWRDERTWAALDYDGPVTERWGIRRLGNAPLPRA